MNSIDFTIVAVYLAGTIAVGLWCRGRQEDVEDYFTAGGRMNSLFQSTLVGLSLAATLFSGIGVLMLPSRAYEIGVMPLLTIPGYLLIWPLLRWFLRHYLAGDNKHPYEIIERKFSLNTRMLAAFMFACVRIGWMAALIYAPTLALLAAARLDDHWFWPIVVIIGVSSTIYTVVGGITSVIITDAIQFLVMVLGVALTVAMALATLPVDASTMVEHLIERGSLHIDFSLDPATYFTFWSVLIGAFVNNASSYIGDQMSLQRYLASGTVKAAGRSYLFNFIGTAIVSLVLAAVGLSLAAWYHFTPDPNLPGEADEVFPYFVGSRLPVGVSGLIMAALLAATISSMTSGVNAIAAAITLDFRRRFAKTVDRKKELFFAKGASLVVGLCATAFAGVVQHLGTIYDIAQIVIGLFAAPLLAAVLLSASSVKLCPFAMNIGLVMGALTGGALKFGSNLAPLWVGPVAFVSTGAAAIVVSKAALYVRRTA